MPTSIEIKSLRDIIFPVKGININRKGGCTFFLLPSEEGLILIRAKKMYGKGKDKII